MIGAFLTIFTVLAIAWIAGTVVVFRLVEGRWPFMKTVAARKAEAEAAIMDAAVDVVIASLMEQPEEWEWDRFFATNRTRRISIWIANGESLLRLSTSGREAMSEQDCVKLSDRSRKALWAVIGAKLREREQAELAARASVIVGRFRPEMMQ